MSYFMTQARYGKSHISSLSTLVRSRTGLNVQLLSRSYVPWASNNATEFGGSGFWHRPGGPPNLWEHAFNIMLYLNGNGTNSRSGVHIAGPLLVLEKVYGQFLTLRSRV